MNEQELIKLYMDLTGTTEPGARSVFMLVCSPADRGDAQSTFTANGRAANPAGQSVSVEPVNSV